MKGRPIDFIKLFERADWMDDGACRERPDVSWFPDADTAGVAAKHICNTECPIRERCHQHALDWPELHGIWGGVNMRQHWRTNGRAA